MFESKFNKAIRENFKVLVNVSVPSMCLPTILTTLYFNFLFINMFLKSTGDLEITRCSEMICFTFLFVCFFLRTKWVRGTKRIDPWVYLILKSRIKECSGYLLPSSSAQHLFHLELSYSLCDGASNHITSLGTKMVTNFAWLSRAL